jgi:orotidine-5'-phosphate decarboxylase
MNRQQLVSAIFSRKSYLCVGLDTDPAKLPLHLQKEKNGVILFNKAIIDATKPYCVAYKINTAFYEALGVEGWEIMQQTVDYIGNDHLVIADAKRGDIGNTSAQYAKAFFEKLPFGAITVAPYMGSDSIKPFLAYKDKWTIVLGLTSNEGAADFELQKIGDAFLYEKVLSTVSTWGNINNLMFVIGATQANSFVSIRKICPNHFFLVPGIGAQGGSLKEISEKAMTDEVGLLVNASRAIIFASEGTDFAEKAAQFAKEYQQEMATYLPAH